MSSTLLPVPDFFKPENAEKVFRVPYQKRAEDAIAWRAQYGITGPAKDARRIALMPIDVQNTFCQPDFELFVGGRSGRGAIEDNVRLCEFIYRNLNRITKIHPTMDTHTTCQIFHPLFWLDRNGKNPAPMTIITDKDVEAGTWDVNPAMAQAIFGDGAKYPELKRYGLHYVKSLSGGGKFPLMVWPYHGILGGIGHALASVVEEAIFFHAIARQTEPGIETKGGHNLTENYSVLGPEVTTTHTGAPIQGKNTRFISKLLDYDAVIICGQAKSHCVAWSIQDLLDEIMAKDKTLAKKVYLVEDLTSAVVVPGIIDFTDQANEAFERFRKAGMNIVRSTDPIEKWPGMSLAV